MCLENLIDKYRLHGASTAFGGGRPLFGGPLRLPLVEARPFPGGAVVMTYTAG